MATWAIIASSAQQPTSNAAYKCFINVHRDTSRDNSYSIATSSIYLFQLYLVRNTTAKIAHNKWTRRHMLTSSIDSGNTLMYWPDSTSGITMQADVPEHLFSFQAELTNDGSSKTVTMLASCEAGVPRDCNVVFTFNTAKRSIKPSNPTNVRWTSHTLSSGNIELSWDESDNAVGYYVSWFVNNTFIGRVRIKYPICLRNDIDDILNPTDVLHARIQAISKTGDVSSSVESPQLRYGDMAKIKIGSSWLHSQPYVKPLGSSKFKPVRAVWIRTTNGWARALDD